MLFVFALLIFGIAFNVRSATESRSCGFVVRGDWFVGFSPITPVFISLATSGDRFVARGKQADKRKRDEECPLVKSRRREGQALMSSGFVRSTDSSPVSRDDDATPVLRRSPPAMMDLAALLKGMAVE